MTEGNIQGLYSDGMTSRTTETRLYETADGRIGVHGIDMPPIQFDALRVSPRIGNTPRYIEFPGGGHFETSDNDSIDALVTRLSPAKFNNFVHKLESSRRMVLVTLIVVIFFGWGFIQFGIPSFSREIAYMLSDEQTRMLGQGVLETMDEHLMEPSELPEARQQELTEVFNRLLDDLQLEDITLEFRKSDSIGANALALPDGTVVFTDDLIVLAEDNNEIASIMLHEIGHIENRHSLRTAIQSFSLAMFVAVITGDVSTASTLITGLPVVLIESGYSREMETEADSYSLYYMLGNDIDPAYFSTIMQKLEVSYSSEFINCRSGDGSIQDCLDEAIMANTTKSGDDDEDDISHYFSSHPMTEERIERFRKASKYWDDEAFAE